MLHVHSYIEMLVYERGQANETILKRTHFAPITTMLQAVLLNLAAKSLARHIKNL